MTMKKWLKIALVVLACVSIILSFIFYPSLMVLIVVVIFVEFILSCRKSPQEPKPPVHPTDEELEFFDCMDDE